MDKDSVLGMIVGCAVGDALGAPYDFMSREDVTFTSECDMISGGTHDGDVGEWTDDTALMLAAAEAYIEKGSFDAGAVAENFKLWRSTGKFGTRNYVFDIGKATDEAINHMTPDRPYAGSASWSASGNGSLMRIAPSIAANHNNMYAAIGESVALALMTHGNHDTIHHISAFVAEMFEGKLPHFAHLRRWDINITNGATRSIMHSYNAAWYGIHYGQSFEGAMDEVIRLGRDTDTNAAITGMLVGSRVGYSNIPKRWLDKLHQHEKIVEIATKLYEIGEASCKYKMFSKD